MLEAVAEVVQALDPVLPLEFDTVYTVVTCLTEAKRTSSPLDVVGIEGRKGPRATSSGPSAREAVVQIGQGIGRRTRG
ncbi:hypothetical protein [Streptomyces sp. NPDC003015]